MMNAIEAYIHTHVLVLSDIMRDTWHVLLIGYIICAVAKRAQSSRCYLDG